MKRLLLITIVFLTAWNATNATAQPKTGLKPDETVLLYAEKLSGCTDPVIAEKVTAAGFTMAEDNGLTGEKIIPGNGFISNIGANARFDLYFPEKPNGEMVIVCPGGGYGFVSSYSEGVYVADWMLAKGITVAVVKYRLPNGHWEIPLTDVQNTFRYCRANAEKWGIDQIGIMGFSAGGHLAGCAATMYDDAETRSDFAVLIYPVVTFEEGITHQGTKDNLIGKESDFTSRDGRTWEEWDKARKTYKALVRRYSVEKQISPDTPPMFIALSSDDSTVPPENSTRLYNSMTDKGVSVEMHIYHKGEHGWGFNTENITGKGNDPLGFAREEFSNSLQRWMESLK